MAEDLVTILLNLPHRWIDRLPPYTGVDGNNTVTKPAELELIQRHYVLGPERWEFTRKYFLTQSPNYLYFNGLLTETTDVVNKAKAILTEAISKVSPLEAPFEAPYQEEKVLRILSSLEENHLSRTSRLLKRFHDVADAVPETTRLVKLPNGSRMLIAKVLEEEDMVRDDELGKALRSEKCALRGIIDCDIETTRIYGAACVARGERTIVQQATSILRCLGGVLPVLACIYFVGDAFHQSSQGEETSRVAKNLFLNVATIFAGFGEGLLLQAIWG